MSNLGDYPIGAKDDPRAPWNQKEQKVNVTVSITLSKELKVTVPKGFTDADLREAAKAQLPIAKNWIVDDYEVILEE